MPRIIGIDLGTTNTAVAVMEAGRPRVIEDERGYKVLPSVISAKGEGKFVVGQAAHNLILTRPERTVYATKRLIGRRYDSAEVQEAIRRVNYKVRPAPDGGVELQVGDQWMSPTEVAAVVLQVAKTIAEKALGERVEEAVISVPAYFNHAQRKATIEAAEMAGLRCDRLLHEPTAAALAFGHRKNVERTILIFDLGGGTFDVSVLRLSSGIYETLSTLGDSYLGGEDLDSRIVDFLVGAFRDRSGVDLTNDRNAVQRIRDAAERAKCELSFADRTNIVIPHITPQHSIDFVLTRAKLEEITADLISRCVEIARRAVVEGGLKLTDVDEVILVGGQTRMPRLREAVTALLGREPSRTVHPEEAVAIGAAVHAANLSDADQSRTVLLDVTPFDLGIDSAGGLFVPVVHRNSRVPASETRTFATANDNQESVRVTVRQGESRNSAENEFLGEFVLTGLSPAPRMQTKVDVTFRVDGNGMLHVSAVEKGSGERKNITIRNYAEHAAAPHLPTPEEAKAEDERAKRLAAQLGDTGAAGKKTGLFEGIIGAFRSRVTGGGAADPKAAVASATSAVATAAAAAAAAATPAAPAVAQAPPVAPGEVLAEEVEPTPVTPELDEITEPPMYDAGIIMPDYSRSPLVGPDEIFALEGDDGTIYNAGGEDEPDLGPAAIGIAGGGPRSVQPLPRDPFASPAKDPFASAARDPFGAARPAAPVSSFQLPPDPSPSEAPSEVGPGRMDANPFDRLRSDITEGDGVRWDAPGSVANDSEGGFDLGVPNSADSLSVPGAPPTGPTGFAIPTGGFAIPEDEPEPAQVTAKSPQPAEESYEDPADFLNQAFGGTNESDLYSDDGGRSVGSDAAEKVAEDARTPNEDDTAVMRRGWAWADAENSSPKEAKPVDLGPDPFSTPAAEPVPSGRKPARVRLRYPDPSRLGEEYRENLRKGGTFIKTPKPLSVGRECVCEVSAPGLDDALLFPAVVTFVATGGPGQESGMGIEYRLSDSERKVIERVIDRL